MSDTEYPEAPFDTDREPVADLTDADIVDEWQFFAGLLVALVFGDLLWIVLGAAGLG